MGKGFTRNFTSFSIRNVLICGSVAKPVMKMKQSERVRAQFLGLEIKLVTPQARHLQIADDGVVLVGFHLEHGFLTVKGDVDEKILVRQDPLQGGGELFIVIHQQNGFQLKRVDAGLNVVWLPFKFHRRSAPFSSRGATEDQRGFALARSPRTYSSSFAAFVSFGSAARHC